MQEQDVLGMLLAQHGQIRELFGQVSEASGERKREMFDDLVRLLAVHETVEEELVHPLARRKVEGGETVVEARLEEEQQAKRALAELYDLGPDHADFNVRLGRLRDAVLEHAEHEEREEFASLRKNVDADRLRRMAGAMRVAEKLAPTRPHPNSPRSAAGNMVLGPPMALFDRIRDAIRESREDDGHRKSDGKP
jgi:hemerythrin superfamily protein